MSYKGVVSKHEEVLLINGRKPFFHSMADLRKIFSRQVLDCLKGRTRSKRVLNRISRSVWSGELDEPPSVSLIYKKDGGN